MMLGNEEILSIAQALWISLRGSLLGVICVCPLSLFLGYALECCSFSGKFFLKTCVMLPLFLPPVATGYLLLLLLGPNSLIGGFIADMLGVVLAFHWYSVSIVAAIVALPLMVRCFQDALARLPKKLSQAACTFGVSRWKSLTHVFLPLLFPALITCFTLGLARAMGEFGATLIFASDIPGQTRTLSLAMNASLRSPDGESMALSFLVISIVMTLGLLFLADYTNKRWEKKYL